LQRLELAEMLKATRLKQKADKEQQDRDKDKNKEKAAATPPSDKEDDSFTKRLITSVINSLQITIDKVHIRYEDDVTHKGVRPNLPSPTHSQLR